MKSFFRTATKVLFDYIVVLIIYVILIYSFIATSKDKFNDLLPYYGMVFLAFAFLLIYLDMNKIAVKERKPEYGYKAYPFKGFVYGLVAVIPLAVIVVIASLIQFKDTPLNNLKHIGVNMLLGPMYFIIRWLKEEPIGYAAAIMVLPVISMLGYLAGYFGIGITNKVKKNKPSVEKNFTKSPWNPTNTSDEKGKGAKKK